MKKVLLIILFLLAVSSPSGATYTYIYGPGTNFGALSLNAQESVLVNGGGGDLLNMFGSSYASIESTTHLTHPYTSGGHGIPEILMFSHSALAITGGEIGRLTLFDSSRVAIDGGSIDVLYGKLELPIPSTPETKFIQVVCKSWDYNSGTKKLTGMWGDDSTFNIQLVDTIGYANTFESINFVIIPEPLSLAIMGLGSLLVRRYRPR